MTSRWIVFLKNAGIALAIPLAAIQLWNWATAPRDALLANVTASEFRWPPTLESELERIYEQRDADSLKELAGLKSIIREDDPDRVGEALNSVIDRLAFELQRPSPSGLPSRLASIRGMYQISVKNSGSGSLSDVRLTVPDAGFLRISRPGQEPTVRSTSKVVELGAMHTRESIDLIIWSESSPTPFLLDGIQVTHKDGIGTVKVFATTGPLG